MKLSERGGVLFKLLAWLLFALLVAVVYLVRHPLLRLAGEGPVVDEPLRVSDAIVVLGDDNLEADRASRAAELYRAGWALRIVVSGRQLRRSAALAELMQRSCSALNSLESNPKLSLPALQGRVIPLLEHAHLGLFVIYSVLRPVLYFRASGPLGAIASSCGSEYGRRRPRVA